MSKLIFRLRVHATEFSSLIQGIPNYSLRHNYRASAWSKLALSLLVHAHEGPRWRETNLIHTLSLLPLEQYRSVPYAVMNKKNCLRKSAILPDAKGEGIEFIKDE